MGMIKNKRTFKTLLGVVSKSYAHRAAKAVAASVVFSFMGLLISQSNLFAQDYFSGHQESISLSELMEDVQVTKADGSDTNFKVEQSKAEATSTPADKTEADFEDSNEFIQFWDDLKEDVWEDICKEAKIGLKEGVDLGDIVGLNGKFDRELKQYPDKRIALIDEVGVELK